MRLRLVEIESKDEDLAGAVRALGLGQAQTVCGEAVQAQEVLRRLPAPPGKARGKRQRAKGKKAPREAAKEKGPGTGVTYRSLILAALQAGRLTRAQIGRYFQSQGRIATLGSLSFQLKEAHRAGLIKVGPDRRWELVSE